MQTITVMIFLQHGVMCAHGSEVETRVTAALRPTLTYPHRHDHRDGAEKQQRACKSEEEPTRDLAGDYLVRHDGYAHVGVHVLGKAFAGGFELPDGRPWREVVGLEVVEWDGHGLADGLEG